MKLWIDDFRSAPKGWLWAKTFAEALDILRTHDIIEVSFDHDLTDGEGNDEKTGYDIALWLASRAFHGQSVPLVYHVHSMNSVGRDRIQGVIDRYLS